MHPINDLPCPTNPGWGYRLRVMLGTRMIGLSLAVHDSASQVPVWGFATG